MANSKDDKKKKTDSGIKSSSAIVIATNQYETKQVKLHEQTVPKPCKLENETLPLPILENGINRMLRIVSRDVVPAIQETNFELMQANADKCPQEERIEESAANNNALIFNCNKNESLQKPVVTNRKEINLDINCCFDKPGTSIKSRSKVWDEDNLIPDHVENFERDEDVNADSFTESHLNRKFKKVAEEREDHDIIKQFSEGLNFCRTTNSKIVSMSEHFRIQNNYSKCSHNIEGVQSQVLFGYTAREDKISVIGKGTFGKVYQMEFEKKGDRNTVKQVAVKVIKKGNKEVNLNETINLIMMSDGRFHQLFPEWFATVCHANAVFIAMEFAALRLDKYVEKSKMTPTQIIDIAWNLLNAARGLFDKRINHGDLKPNNILVNEDGQALKVTDFGTSSRYLEQKEFSFKGRTPYYCPPEVCEEPCRVFSKSDMPSCALVILYLHTRIHTWLEIMGQADKLFPKREELRSRTEYLKRLQESKHWLAVNYRVVLLELETLQRNGTIGAEMYQLLHQMLQPEHEMRICPSTTLDQPIFKDHNHDPIALLGSHKKSPIPLHSRANIPDLDETRVEAERTFYEKSEWLRKHQNATRYQAQKTGADHIKVFPPPLNAALGSQGQMQDMSSKSKNLLQGPVNYAQSNAYGLQYSKGVGAAQLYPRPSAAQSPSANKEIPDFSLLMDDPSEGSDDINMPVDTLILVAHSGDSVETIDVAAKILVDDTGRSDAEESSMKSVESMPQFAGYKRPKKLPPTWTQIRSTESAKTDQAACAQISSNKHLQSQPLDLSVKISAPEVEKWKRGDDGTSLTSGRGTMKHGQKSPPHPPKPQKRNKTMDSFEAKANPSAVEDEKADVHFQRDNGATSMTSGLGTLKSSQHGQHSAKYPPKLRKSNKTMDISEAKGVKDDSEEKVSWRKSPQW